MLDLLKFFLVSLSSTFEVSIMVGFGIILAYVGFVNKTMIRKLSEVTLWMLTPCLLAHNFATNVTLDLLRKAWPIVLFGIFYQGIGYLIVKVVFWKRIWGEDRISDCGRRVLNCSVIFNNANSLPFLFVVALCKTGAIFQDRQTAASLAIAYVSVYLLPTRFTFWSYTLFAFKSDHKAAQPIHSPNEVTILISKVVDMERSKTVRDRLKEFPWKKMLLSIVSPPVVGMMLGLLIGIVPALKQNVIIDPPEFLTIFDHITTTYGGAMFPVSMIILGTNLYDTYHSSQQTNLQNLQEQSGIHHRITNWLRRNIFLFNHPIAVIISCFLRLVVMPLIAIGLVIAAMKIQLLPSNDPVILLVLMVEGATPCAMNLAVAVNLSDDPTLANAMCEIMLFQYLLSPLTMALLSTWHLSLACNITSMCLIQ
jgi:predicted permease